MAFFTPVFKIELKCRILLFGTKEWECLPMKLCIIIQVLPWLMYMLLWRIITTIYKKLDNKLMKMKNLCES